MSELGNSSELDALAARLGRPASSLQALAMLDRAQQAELIASVDRVLSTRQSELDRALRRLLPWPLRTPLLRWLRR